MLLKWMTGLFLDSKPEVGRHGFWNMAPA